MSEIDDRTRITQILVDARDARGDASARLAEALYPELRRLAAVGYLSWPDTAGLGGSA